MESLREAINQEIQIQTIPKPKIDLIVDGGSENNNHTIESFIKSSHVTIDKKVALKDVTFSNSVVEGNFRIMKQSYFRRRTILSDTIAQEMDYFVEDYNYHRSNYVHEIYTPDEIHQDSKLKNIWPITKASLKDRIASNKNRKCIKKC